MDIQDESASEMYAGILRHQLELLQSAKRRAGQLPQSKPTKEELIFNHDMISFQQAMSSGGDYHIMQAFIGPAYPPSTTPLQELQTVFCYLCPLRHALTIFLQMKLKDMRLETHHRGNVLIVKMLVEPTRITGIGTVVEDFDGNADRLQIFNQPLGQDPKVLFPSGHFVAVKEPYYVIKIKN